MLQEGAEAGGQTIHVVVGRGPFRGARASSTSRAHCYCTTADCSSACFRQHPRCALALQRQLARATGPTRQPNDQRCVGDAPHLLAAVEESKEVARGIAEPVVAGELDVTTGLLYGIVTERAVGLDVGGWLLNGEHLFGTRAHEL